MLENFGVFRYPERMEKQIEVIGELRARYDAASWSRTRARSSTAT